ncbi:hypothetical protein ACVWXD_001746 [Pseudomonas sp. TE3911]
MYLMQQGEPFGSASHSGAGQACSPQRSRRLSQQVVSLFSEQACSPQGLWRLWQEVVSLFFEQASHHRVVCDCGVGLSRIL